MPSLQVKPFGKNGVRLVYSDAGDDAMLEVCAAEDTVWQLHASVTPGDGVLVVKSACIAGPPRAAKWRLQSGASVTEPECLVQVGSACGASKASGTAASRVLLDDLELAFNVLQWFGTVVVDFRSAPPAELRLRESMAVGDVAAAAALPLKDDVLCLGADDAGADNARLDAVAGRVRRCVYQLTDAALAALCVAHPCLCGAAAERRPVLPNLVGGSLLVGHQGHALCIGDWAPLLPLSLIVNLAPDRVDATAERAVVAAAAAGGGRACALLEVRCDDGEQLTDKPADGERLLQVLPGTLAAIADAAQSGGMAFVHCQQGRSRAGSMAAAHVLATHDGWSLYDALRFLAARRPEVELQQCYLDALERWAVDSLGRPPSVARVREELPRAVRPDPLGKRNEMRTGVAPPPGRPLDGDEPSDAMLAPSAARSVPPPSPLMGRGGFGRAAFSRAGSVGKQRPG